MTGFFEWLDAADAVGWWLLVMLLLVWAAVAWVQKEKR